MHRRSKKISINYEVLQKKRTLHSVQVQEDEIIVPIAAVVQVRMFIMVVIIENRTESWVHHEKEDIGRVVVLFVQKQEEKFLIVLRVDRNLALRQDHDLCHVLDYVPDCTPDREHDLDLVLDRGQFL